MDIQPITNALLQLVASIILALGGVAITRLVQWLGLKNAAAARAGLDEALDKAVTFGLAQSQDLIRQKGWDNVEVHNAALASAAPYLIDRFPDVLKSVGLDPADPQTGQRIATALLRTLPHAAVAAANSPATPPFTAPNPATEAELGPIRPPAAPLPA